MSERNQMYDPDKDAELLEEIEQGLLDDHLEDLDEHNERERQYAIN